MTNQGFKAFTRICLNNWHYISHRVLSLNPGVNFFTGHSGSGKSTIIDAMQIVLYANTDGRGFFNKAAADDSDRSLIEYLRGMVNIEENNRFAYLRNSNFSSAIVLELSETSSGEAQCIGVVFDVETASNSVNRMFFWHRGTLPSHVYRTKERAMTIDEVRNYLKRSFAKEDCYYGPHNERFRSQLYSTYLGGLDREKFPLLFKRAIPFKMNVRLEDFVKEYICTEDDIHIGDMQESVMQYGRMKKKLDDTVREMEELKSLRASFDRTEETAREQLTDRMAAGRAGILALRGRLIRISGETERAVCEAQRQEAAKKELDRAVRLKEEASEELLRRIASTGYEDLKEKIRTLDELIRQYEKSEARFRKTVEGLKGWEEADCTGNQTLWDISAFEKGDISGKQLLSLKESLDGMRKEADEERKEAESEIRRLKRAESEAQASLKELKQGRKAYPRELMNARTYIQKRFLEEFKKPVQVEILADLLDIKSDRWRNAVEGYLGGNKLALVVEPKYVRFAMEFYNELDRRAYFRVAVVDTERAAKEEHAVLPNALCEEVAAGTDYVQAYVDFLLGKVVKCESVGELRKQRIGITDDCLLYHNYRLQYINPENYTRGAYIGALSVKKRIENLEEELKELKEEREPFERTRDKCDAILSLEPLALSAEEYGQMFEELKSLKKKRAGKKRQEEALARLESGQISAWEKEREALKKEMEQTRAAMKAHEEAAWKQKRDIQAREKLAIDLNEALLEEEKEAGRLKKEAEERFGAEAAKAMEAEAERRIALGLSGGGKRPAPVGFGGSGLKAGAEVRNAEVPDAKIPDTSRPVPCACGDKGRPAVLENGREAFADGLEAYALERPAQCERLKESFLERAEESGKRGQEQFERLEQQRIDYLRRHPGRTCPASCRGNDPYDSLLAELSCDRLPEYREKAARQARTAVEHFKDDFIFKIRSAIREAFNQRDELNRIISSLDFGKDRYRFVIEKNRGADGKYFDMFMDESLEINPASLNRDMENQMNFFTMEHEDRYGAMMKELIEMFIPPEDAGEKAQEEARRQMEKYADYRTYLSFDMQQIIEGAGGDGKPMYIPLSRMIRKNSGGEGQNPFYVALLASFAKAYRINLPDSMRRGTTIRLVVLDEAFSKMDAEKVASCIRLIRGLGFQAIISATNDKIQNYLENVDKTFVFANPGKRSISVQEFERKEFLELKEE